MSGFYDLMLMLDPTAPEERRTAVLSEAESMINSGGELVTNDDWGTRRMAYEIDHRPEAEYRLYQFNGDNDAARAAEPAPADHRRRAALPHHQGEARPAAPPPPDQQAPRRRDDREPQDTKVAARAAADAPAADEALADAPPADAPAADAAPSQWPRHRLPRRRPAGTSGRGSGRGPPPVERRPPTLRRPPKTPVRSGPLAT